MKITRNNYEIFFLDFHEGRLDAGLRAELMTFLNNNADLKDEFYSYDAFELAGESGRYPEKEDLYREFIPVDNISSENIEEMIIASLEGDLDPIQSERLDQFIEKNPAYGEMMELYGQTKLQIPSIEFPGKRSLKKRNKKAIIVYLAPLAAAASILLFIFIGRLTHDPGQEFKYSDSTGITPLPKVENPIFPQNNSRLVAENRPQVTEKVKTIYFEETTRNEDITGIVTLKPVTRSEVTLHHPSFVNRYLISRYEGVEAAQLMLAQWVDEEPSGNRSTVGRILAGLFDNAKDIVTSGQEQASREDFTIWKLADIGIRSYNTLADRDISLETYTDEETGKVKSYQITENDQLIRSKVLKQDP